LPRKIALKAKGKVSPNLSPVFRGFSWLLVFPGKTLEPTTPGYLWWFGTARIHSLGLEAMASVQLSIFFWGFNIIQKVLL